MQKIESGVLRGRRLAPLPKGVEGLRPTSAMVRAAIFDRLGGSVEGARVLDLFAGSGALSFEAISRGAGHAWLIDADARVARYVEEQARTLGVAERVRVTRGDSLAILRRGRSVPAFDLALIDPPFARPELIEPLLAELANGWLTADAVIVCERERIRGKSVDVAWPTTFELELQRVYGQAEVEFRRVRGTDEGS